MSQPPYSELGKSCKDFFSKGYHFGIFKISTKNNASNGMETVATGTHTMEDKSVLGELEVKNPLPYGIKLTSKWDTTNLLTNKFEVQDKLVQGLKIVAETQYNLDTNAKLAKLNTQYRLDRATIDIGIEGGDEANLLVNGAVVLGYRNFLTGYKVEYDTNDGSIKNNNVTLGYIGNGFTLHTAMDNAETIVATGLYNATNNLETGITATYTSGDDSATRCGAGIKYSLDPCTSLKAKIDNTGSLGIGYDAKMPGGAMFTFCTQIDTPNISSGGHKVGFALEFGQ